MHFYVLTENLNKALSIVGRNIPIRPQLPILANLLLKAKDNQLQISTNNLELGIVYNIGAKVEKEGEITVPGKLLVEFIANLKAEKLEMILEGSNLIVKSGKAQASFATVTTTDYPTFPQIPETKKKLALEKIKQSVERSVFAASIDETRPVLTGVRIIISKGKISFTATDGYRLSIDQTDYPDNKEELNIILPAQSLNEIIRIAGELKENNLEFHIIANKNQVVFKLPNVVIFTQIIDGDFPNVEKIIPQNFKTKITIDTDKLGRSIKIASLFARSAANIVKLKIEKEGLWILANNPQLGENKDFIEAKVDGEETEIAFNYRFILDLLNNFPEKEIVLEASGPLSPGVFKSVSTEEAFLHLIMPVRIQS